MRRTLLILTALCAATLSAGCVEDNPVYGIGDAPFIDLDAVTPTPLVVLERDLATGPVLTFTVTELADSGDDTLYARAVYDTGARAVVIDDSTLPPSVGPRGVELTFQPCSAEHRIFIEEALDLTDSDTAFVALHLVLSDAPFSSNATQALPDSLEGGITSLFATDDASATRGLLTWNLELTGPCPAN